MHRKLITAYSHLILRKCFAPTLFGLLIFLGCAKQGYPPGGPEDKAGPLVRSSYPQPGEVQVPVKVRPWILLNEYPQRTSVAGSIFISPVPSDGFETRVRGKRLEIRFAAPLPPNTTVVITFGTGIKDLNNGNPMSQPYVLAFSTGDFLDQAVIEGSIAGLDKPGSVWVWAYPMDSLAAAPFQEGDRGGLIYPDPRQDKAPFASQPDDQGRFQLTNLPIGSYRVFAVQEARNDRLWQSQTEAIAFPARDVLATLETPPRLSFRLTQQDLTPPKLIGAESLHRQGIRLSFSEPVSLAGARITALTKTGQTLSIISAYQNPADSGAVLLATAIQREGDVYIVRTDSLRDRFGNVGDSLVAEVEASVTPDTIGPRLTRTIPASGDLEVDPNSGIQISFSEAVTLTDLPHAVHLTDSAGVEVPGTWGYPFPAKGIFTPSKSWAGSTKYFIYIYGDSLRDIFGVVAPDSISSISFRTLDPNNLGAISGKVAGAVSDLRLVADRLQKPGGSWETVVAAEGDFRLENLPGADYYLWLYQDLDHNQHWSSGRLSAVGGFAFAEPFSSARDSLHVRPGWETEVVEVEWKP